MKRDVSTSVAEVEKLIKESARATGKLGVNGSERSPEHAQRACDIATVRQHEGQFALNVVRELLLNLQRDLTVNNAESSVLADFTKLLEGVRSTAGRVGQAQGRSP